MERPSDTVGFSAADFERLQRLARSLATPAEADDLVQDAWLAARGADHDGQPAWWRTVLRRRRAMGARASARRSVRESRAELEPANALDPGVVAERSQLCTALEAALDRLPPLERALIVHRYCEDRSAAELSAEFDVPASTVRTKLSRSLQTLRKHLDRAYGGRAAWMGCAIAWAPTSSALPTSALIMTSTTTKVFAAVAVGTLIVATVAFATLDDAPADEATPPATAVASSAPPKSSMRASVNPADVDRTSQRKEWQQIRASILDSRVTTPPLPVEREPSVIEGEDPEAIAADILRDLEDARALGPRFSELMEEGVPLFVECLESLPESATGTLELRAELIGEPGLGGIVDSVEVVDDSLHQPAVEECLRESTYAIRLDEVDETISQAVTISLDLDERSLHVGTNLDMDAIARLHEEAPDTWNEMLSKPDTLAGFAEIAKMPEIAEQFPELTASINAAVEAAAE